MVLFRWTKRSKVEPFPWTATRESRSFQGGEDVNESSSQWLRLKEVRNLIVHEYEDNTLEQLDHEILKLSPVIIALEKLL